MPRLTNCCGCSQSALRGGSYQIAPTAAIERALTRLQVIVTVTPDVVVVNTKVPKGTHQN